MVDVQTPVNGDSTEQAETSRDGLRRMQRLTDANRSRAHTSYSTAFNPLTSSLVYPPSGTGTHHVITSVFADTPPRPLPFPPVLSSSGVLSLSPDGAWIVGYHTAPSLAMQGGSVFIGDLFVFSSQILEPGMTMGQFMPAATFPIGVTMPLSGVYLYPPRTRLGPGGQRAAPALGPAPPPGYAASKSRGPTCLFMTADVMYFLHPHPVPATVVLDTRSSAAVPGESISAAGGSDAAPLNWTINALKCPLGSRSYTDLSSMAGQMAPLPAFGAQRGWFGMVGGSDGVWAAVEKDGEVQVIRVDVGLDANNMPYVSTTPLPALPRPQVPPFADSTAVFESHLLDLVFVPLKDHGTMNGSADDTKDDDGAIGCVLVYRDVDDIIPPTRCRMRFELVEIRQRPVTVVAGFKDLGSGDDAASPLDWLPSPTARRTAMSPEGINILSLTPLPDVPPHTLALALVSGPTGLSLTHVNLVPSSEACDTDGAGTSRWPAFVGEECSVDMGLILADAVATPSQGTRRGEMGLVAIFGGSRPRLLPSPRLGAAAHPVETVKHVAERAARSIELAVVQGVDWSDAVRAAFATVPRGEAGDLASAILDKALSLFIQHSRSYVPHILRLQVAVWALAEDPRMQLAAELIRLGEAGQIMYLCGDERDGVISFDLDSVWNLVDVFEFALSSLGGIFRDAVAEKASAEWSPSEPRTEGSTRVLYLIHPLLRRILVRLVALLAAFAKFVANLDRPIRPPDSAFLITRSAPASAVAAARVQDALVREGVDLALWGDVLAALGKAPRPNDADTVASLLKLDLAPIATLLPPLLAALPTPSALFTCPAPSPERDGATCAVIGDMPTAHCDRCGARTVLQVHNVMRGGVPSPWSAWRRTWVSGCMCGGTWMRTQLEAPAGLRR